MQEFGPKRIWVIIILVYALVNSSNQFWTWSVSFLAWTVLTSDDQADKLLKLDWLELIDQDLIHESKDS